MEKTISIYHYTSPEGLLGILNKGKPQIWFSRYDLLNDKEEGTAFPAKTNNINDLFVSSFSKNGDSLPMWNYYSKNGKYLGYNIELKVSEIKDDIQLKFGEENSPFKEELVASIIAKLFVDYKTSKSDTQELSRFIEDNQSFNYDKDLFLQGKYIKNNWIEFVKKLCSLAFKNESFFHEEEVRYAFKEEDLKKVYFINKNKNGKKYRIVNGIIIPYYEIEIKPEYVKSITMAPLIQERDSSGLRDYLDSYGYNDVEIKMSDIKIRY